MLPFTELRDLMVSEQLIPRGISDPAVLKAMGQVPREAFVPSDLSPYAYDDTPLPIGYGQTISQPYVVALMSESALVKPGDRVLEVGSGSGYQAAILAELGAEVYAIERIPELAAMTAENLKRAGYKVVSKEGDGYEGWPEFAPFDAILVTAAAAEPPRPLMGQLKVGGRLIIPVGPLDFQELFRFTSLGEGEFAREALCPVRFVPLITPFL
ncbi:MAG: protein-L-isoaspartate(D-aspartate) O-methyltransferase [Parachlamydiales bacterium]